MNRFELFCGVLSLWLLSTASCLKVANNTEGNAIEWCSGNLTYTDGTPLDTKIKNHEVPIRKSRLTGLMSYPGSGNTWLRYLLQQATGIVTGSVYMDGALKKGGFPGENMQNNLVVQILV